MGVSPELPDLCMPGLPALAEAFNAGVADNARKCVYPHPEDVQIVAGISLPTPRERDATHGNTDHVIQEEGVYAGSKKQLEAMSIAALSGDEEEGRTLTDLPWPISGRIAP